LDLSKPLVHTVLPWTHPRHRSTPVLPWTIQATGSLQCSLGLIQAIDSLQCSLGLIQATGPPQCSLGLSKPPVHSSAPLDSSKPPVHPSAPLDYPSHRFTPVGVVLFHCTRLQCSLHFYAYTLAMQSMVSTFIQHPSTYPSRYLILMYLLDPLYMMGQG
jgi:hypothetical protein